MVFTLFQVIVIALIAFALGYAFRKYAFKEWPDEAKMVDALAKKYGDQGEFAVKNLMERAKAKAAEIGQKF